MNPNAPYLITLAVLALAIALVAYLRRREAELLAGIAGMMQASAWVLIRHMENDPVGTPGKLARKREELIQRIAIEGAERLKLVAGTEFPGNAPMSMMMPPMPSNDPKLTSAAQELLARNEAESSKFWFKANGIRTGIQVFMAIMVLRNVAAAFVLMTDHMKKQRDEWRDKQTKRSPNFTELKMVLGLPTDWPADFDPEDWQSRGISEQRALRILLATERYRDRIFRGVLYKPYPREGEEVVEYEGEALLTGMREYIR